MVKKTEVPVDDYKRNVWKRSIILCWIFLAISVVIKFIYWDFFNIESENARFIRLCDWIDKHIVALLSIQCVVYLIGNFLFVFALCGYRAKRSDIILLACCFIIMFASKMIGTTIGMVVEIVGLCLIGLKYCIPILSFKRASTLAFYALICVFQIISMFIKNITGYVLPDYSLIGLIYTIDYYIMLALLMLYRN